MSYFSSYDLIFYCIGLGLRMSRSFQWGLPFLNAYWVLTFLQHVKFYSHLPSPPGHPPKDYFHSYKRTNKALKETLFPSNWFNRKKIREKEVSNYLVFMVLFLLHRSLASVKFRYIIDVKKINNISGVETQ
jgi:hypothetical protein